MSHTFRATVMIVAAASALSGMAGERLYAQGADPNAAPNPYKMQENWVQLPEGRKFGAAIKVQVDHSDGKSIWVFDRCGERECTNSTLAPMQKFDSSGKFQNAIGAGMFAMLPFLSIYLQGVLGYTPLGAGLRFLPLTVFVFAIPLLTRNLVQHVPAQVVLGVSLALVASALLLMHGISVSSTWTALLAGLIVSGIGIGLANPTIASTALRVVDPERTGMASGINNAFRLAGVAVGVAALGAVLEDRASSSLAGSLGPRGRELAAAVSSTGNRVAAGDPHLAHPATTAFVAGLNSVLVVGCVIVAVGALAAAALIRTSQT